jgi:hypothetical protein
MLPSCRDVDHSSRTDRKPRRKGRFAGLDFRTKRDSGRLRGERTGEKALCTGVATRHDLRLSKPRRSIGVISPGENLVTPKYSDVVQMLHENIMALRGA